MLGNKLLLVVAVVGTAAIANAGFGDFLKKATDVATAVNQVQNGQPVQPVQQQAVVVQPVAAPVAAQPAVDDGATLGEVNSISMDELARRMKKHSSLVVIDVRTPGEYSSGHIPHAKNVPVNTIGSRIGNIVADRNTPVYLYCKGGVRAQTAAETLVSMGYQRVYNAGGIGDWDGKIVR